ncbi:Isoxanthopterin deaminase [Aquimixticola soesokkakensis]|uniref:Isoxanthopterin deaminase n=1 Tax=Aquimixticola soesokkakensis TaxID=1519096 RepID=A0A1Y5TIT4_9RHOB|nr:amidohydrolase family protein [Aquimixticola soesokkakensis]SLN64635.1 Isoxanthopterin deaminase [Aquimixticola soesokkakensis]
MSDFLITNIAQGLTGDRAGTRFAGALRVRGGRIAALGALSPEQGEQVVDARGCVVTPGLVNTHHHLFQSILKGVPEGVNEALDIWLAEVPYRYWPLITREILQTSARIGMAELALTGCTTVSDHHYIFSERYDYDPAEVLFGVAAEFGMRFVLARGGMTKGRAFADATMPPSPNEPLAQMLERIAATAARFHDRAPDAMTRVAVAPTTPTFNLFEPDLREIAGFARNLGLRLHAHLNENTAYAAFTQKMYGQRPLEWLARHDWLGDDVWFAHLVDLSERELDLLAETNTGMAHCPQANARLGSGVAPADRLHALGGRVSLAVDGAGANEAADMGAALYSAFTLHRATKGVGAMRPETILHWATMGGAQALDLPAIGEIAVGKAADLALFDLSAPRFMGLHDLALGPIICAGAPVKHSFVAGRPVVVNGALPQLDLATLAAQSREAVADLRQALRAAQ